MALYFGGIIGVSALLIEENNMNQKTFLKHMEAGFAKNLDIARAKNADYSVDDDAFQNFRACTAFGIPVEIGILVRMTDKMTRISNLLNKEANVKDETIADTIADLSNYAMILKVYVEHEKKK